MRGLVVRFFNNLAWQTGTAWSRTVSTNRVIRRGAHAHPFDLDLMAAVVAGAFEALERRPFNASWSKQDGDYLIRVEIAEGKPELSERLEIRYLPLRPGDHHLQTCPSCGIPIGMGNLEWRENEGIIVDRRSGTRKINLERLYHPAVNQELLRELGEEALPIS